LTVDKAIEKGFAEYSTITVSDTSRYVEEIEMRDPPILSAPKNTAVNYRKCRISSSLTIHC